MYQVHSKDFKAVLDLLFFSKICLVSVTKYYVEFNCILFFVMFYSKRISCKLYFLCKAKLYAGIDHSQYLVFCSTRSVKNTVYIQSVIQLCVNNVQVGTCNANSEITFQNTHCLLNRWHVKYFSNTNSALEARV